MPPSTYMAARIGSATLSPPGPLVAGSLASLERQNARLEADGLERILDEQDLANRIRNGLLVPLPASSALVVNPGLDENHRYCRTWTARFLADLARAHAAAFHKPLDVTSAVRTVEYQKRLIETNGNAAAAEKARAAMSPEDRAELDAIEKDLKKKTDERGLLGSPKDQRVKSP